ncbi:MAG: lipocalin-like domain-containing protein [Rhodospirillales bacterium]
MVVPKELIGTWRFVGFKLTDDSGRETFPWTEESTGYLMYTPDGHMSATITSMVKQPDGPPKPLTTAYAGPFECHDTHVLHKVTVSTQPDLVGTVQRRDAVVNGKDLTLRSTPSLFGGPGSKAELSWTRA